VGDESRARVPTKRIDYVDGLRALAALWVVLHHAIETSEPTSLLGVPVVGPALASLFFGQFPVMIFLLLSGFCLFFPYVKKNPLQPAFSTGYASYLKRRAARIAPPYLWAGAFCLALLAIPGTQVGRWQITGPVSTGVIISHLLFVHNLIPSHAAKIDYPMWSIGLEWQLYLLFPLMIWLFRKFNGVILTAACVVLAAVIRATYRQLPIGASAVLRDGPLSYLEIFALGMLAAQLTVRGTRVAPKWLLGMVALAGAVVIRLGSGNGLVHDLAASAAAFALLTMAIEPDSAVSRVLSAPWLVRIGLFSYSIYLVHAPLLHVAWLALRPLSLSPNQMFAALVFVGVPLIVALAYAFHVAFERPFMRSARSQVGRLTGASEVEAG
jgi:peptidoglycan/LPS O-acetylase OafA/YrhL